MTASHIQFPPFSMADAAKAVEVNLISYGEHPDQVVERYGHPRADKPTLFLIHGGYWRDIFDREHLRPIAVELAKLGWPIAIPEYRRIAGNPDATIEDIDSALAVVAAEAVILIGFSTGGQFALLRANSHKKVQKIIGLAPVVDLINTEELGLGRNALLEWLPEGARSRPDLDPIFMVHQSAPIVIIHGLDDERVPIELSRNYTQKMQNCGFDVLLIELANTGHFELMNPSGVTFERLLKVIS
jgi:acetyl esterase/lipase